uniref:C-type lectin domain-containing protein n=1 Tax=Amphilophus citrinellus TaxID=61819 RepID=A0A3Q0S343_AMPCI
MGSLVNSAAAFLSTSLLVLLFGFSSVLAQDLRETDALCNSDGCFVVYFQRKTFLDSWRACKEKGGNLATIKQKEDATTIATLFSTVDLRHSRTKVQVWIGLQRQPRQCTTTHPLRGFSWTTGDQDTEYTNWQNEDSPSLCSVPRCVAVSYSTQVQDDNFKWLDGACVVSVDGCFSHFEDI